MRSSIQSDTSSLSLIDLGAGSFNKLQPQRQVKVTQIYKRSCHSAKDTELLFRLVDYFKPHTILELGTCLGVSTLYLASANKNSKVYTFEGNPDYASFARRKFQQFGCNSITLIEGNIHHTLSSTLEQIPSLDFAFLDAHHAYEPTIKFFKSCLSKVHSDSVIILDDIYWSEDMQKAWETIKGMPEVKQTIDLYQFGIVFFKQGQVKEHFTLRY